MTSCFIWILWSIHLIHKISEMLKVLKLNFFLNLEDNWTMPTFHQQMFSMNTITMICSYSTKRLIPHLTISTFRTSHVCENLDHILIHATNLSHAFALPQFMVYHDYEDLMPPDIPSTVPTTFQASSDQPLNPRCAHNTMTTQCNQSQYLTLLNKICAHNPSGILNNQVSLSNSLASP